MGNRAWVVKESDAVRAIGGKFSKDRNKAQRDMLYQYLDGLRGEEHTHVWLNLSQASLWLLTRQGEDCPGLTGRKDRRATAKAAFSACIGRLIAMPRPQRALADARDRLLAEMMHLERRLPYHHPPRRSYDFSIPHFIGVHVRTFGLDMKLPADAQPDPDAALAFLAWEVMVTPQAYAAAIRATCFVNATQMPRLVYVASDSRSVPLLFEKICPGLVVHSNSSVRRSHTERRRHHVALQEERDGLQVAMLDLLMLSQARAVMRFGAQHSTFAQAAFSLSCGGRIWRTPKSWRYKAAGSWLLSKLNFYLGKLRQNRSLECDSPFAHKFKDTPCTSGCLHECHRLITSAYT